jgi:hypothetical protein
MSIFNYIDELFKECPDDLMKGVSSSGAAAHPYNVNCNAEKLDPETAILYHPLTAKLLSILNQTQPAIQTPVSILTTHVNIWKKFGCCLCFLCDTK